MAGSSSPVEVNFSGDDIRSRSSSKSYSHRNSSPNVEQNSASTFPGCEPANQMPLISFPGGGMFFYWQLGALAELERHYDLQRLAFSGASAGALAATLAACGINGKKATELAFELSRYNGLWDRPVGLVGVWGRLVREWLDILLPEDAAEMCRGRLHIFVLELPSLRRRKFLFQRSVVSDFVGKVDVIDCCMASVHIPFFMDMHPWGRFRSRRVWDGSILASREDLETVMGRADPLQTVYLDYTDDEEMRRNRSKFLSLSSQGEGGGEERTWAWVMTMMTNGEEFVRHLYESEKLAALSSARLETSLADNGIDSLSKL